MTKRSERTKQKIQHALLTMLNDKPYESISMGEVAEAAGCSRVTVHRHYGTKEGLLLDCVEEMLEAIKDDLVYPNDDIKRSTSQDAYRNLVTFYTHVAEHRVFYRTLFSTASGNKVRSRIRRVIAGAILHFWIQDKSWHKLGSVTPSMLANLIGEIIVGAVIGWVESDSDDKPEMLAEIVLRLIETGMFGLMKQTPTAADISYLPLAVPQGKA